MSNLLNTKGGPRGTRQNKLQNLDSIHLQGEPKGLHADIGTLKGFVDIRLSKKFCS